MKITLTDRLGTLKTEVTGENQVTLDIIDAFGFEDILIFETEAETFVKINLDPTINPSIIYTPTGIITYQIPVGAKSQAYHPEAFKHEGSYQITMEKVSDDELATRRNLAMNGMDKRWDTGYFPHASANVVTRDEPWFEAKNAIDGHIKNDGHGAWPFQSWGGGLRDDLEFTLDFGREVVIDEIVIYLRADFVNDHDVNWETGTVELSDGTELPFTLRNTGDPQSIKLEATKVTGLKLKDLKREVSAAFTALTQFEVYGVEA